MAPLIKNPYDFFYKVLTFKWYVLKFKPNRIISYELHLFKWRYCCKFSKQWKNLNVMCWKSIAFWWRENTVQAKQWLDKCYSDSKQWLRAGMLTLNDAECLGCSNLVVVPENTQKTLQTHLGQL